MKEPKVRVSAIGVLTEEIYVKIVVGCAVEQNEDAVQNEHVENRQLKEVEIEIPKKVREEKGAVEGKIKVQV